MENLIKNIYSSLLLLSLYPRFRRGKRTLKDYDERMDEFARELLRDFVDSKNEFSTRISPKGTWFFANALERRASLWQRIHWDSTFEIARSILRELGNSDNEIFDYMNMYSERAAKV